MIQQRSQPMSAGIVDFAVTEPSESVLKAATGMFSPFSDIHSW